MSEKNERDTIGRRRRRLAPAENRIVPWLEQQLRRRDWSWADLARRLDATPSVVSGWRTGRRRPSPSMCVAIADVFMVDEDYVFGLAGQAPMPVRTNPDAPGEIIAAKARRLRWSDDRFAMMAQLLDTMHEQDRRDAASKKREL